MFQNKKSKNNGADLEIQKESQARMIGTDRLSAVMAGWIFGAVMTKTPSELKLETTESCLQPLGKVYFLKNCLEMKLRPSSDCSLCLASTVKLLFITLTVSSSGLYIEVSMVISKAFSSSLTLMTFSSLNP